MSSVVGIMGGICSGKSTVAQMLSEHGFTLIDADKIAHEMLHRESIQKQLQAAFGNEVIDEEGNINNEYLAKVGFSSPEMTSRLNDIMHPPVIHAIDRRIKRADPPILLDAALLVEKGLHKHYCDVLVYVDAPESQRRKRAHSNRNWDEDEVSRREQLQVSLSRKKKLADIIVDNRGSKQELASTISDLRDQIMERLAASENQDRDPGDSARSHKSAPH
ncbi:MAG: dephospho-CoA kinase [Planctomycetota bacterium]